MNNPAPKEPSMDEILSSIRQIIAEDDAVTRKPAASAVPFTPMRPPMPANAERAPLPVPDATPLALSPEQIITAPVVEDVPTAVAGVGLDAEAQALVDALADEPEPLPVPEVEVSGTAEPQGYAEAELVEPDDIGFDVEDEVETAPPGEPVQPAPRVVSMPRVELPRPTIPAAEAAPMPDPMLSSDLADKLLKPATDAAVRHTFARLGNVAVGAPGVTLEDMMREMLRPMLKEWLDENLPSVVERMVEREIARISRGVE